MIIDEFEQKDESFSKMMQEEDYENVKFLEKMTTPISRSNIPKRPLIGKTTNTTMKRPKIEFGDIEEKPSISDLQRDVLEKEKRCLQSIERFCEVGVKFFEAGMTFLKTETKMKSEIFGDLKNEENNE